MKRIVAMCPHCAKTLVYKNWFYWVLRNPFHWFRKKRITCPECGHRTYVVGVRVF